VSGAGFAARRATRNGAEQVVVTTGLPAKKLYIADLRGTIIVLGAVSIGRTGDS